MNFIVFTFDVFQREMSSLKFCLILNNKFMSVTLLTSQSPILPYFSYAALREEALHHSSTAAFKVS